MRLFIVFLMISWNGINLFAQPDCILIALDILISDQETGVPTTNAKVTLAREDSLTFRSTTDANGRISVNDSTAAGFMEIDHSYTLEVEGVLKKYLGTNDAFTTMGITCNTRIIRDLKVLTMYCCRMHSPEIIFTANAAQLDSAALAEISYVNDLLIENPTIAMEVAGYYDTENEKKLAIKRTTAVYQKLLEYGIPADRLVMRTWARPVPAKDDWANPGEYPERPAPDVTFLILSFDYKP